jgi:hypothetical protein
MIPTIVGTDEELRLSVDSMKVTLLEKFRKYYPELMKM